MSLPPITSLFCSVCMFVDPEEVPPLAVTVLDGNAVCENCARTAHKLPRQPAHYEVVQMIKRRRTT